MSFYHWFSSHPNEINLSGEIHKMQDIGKELRIVDAKQKERPKQTDFRRISSVPDIWSQHRLFEMLLLNKAEDPSYLEYEAIAKREWRAMLAILVLAESYGVEIHSESIRFSAPVNNPYLRAAYSTRPNEKLWPNMEVYFIKAGETHYPIAMSSPTVHVIPTKDAWRNLRLVYPGLIPWVTDNQVHAPITDEDGLATPFLLGEREAEKTPAMMPVHALMLQRWLVKYREELAEQQRKTEMAASLLDIRLITEYEQALSDAFRLNTERMPRMTSFFASAERQEGLRIGDMRVPKNLRVFLDRAFYSVIDQSSTQAEIFDTHRYAGGIAKECLVSKVQKDGKIAHFFVAMPVTEMFWQLWRDNEDLSPAYSLQCVFSADGVYVTKITASIVIGDITFSRTFPIARIDTDFWRNLCTAGIWPRQKLAGWQDYYLFCNEIGGYRLEPEVEVVGANRRTYPKCDHTDGEISYYRLSNAPERCVLLKNGNRLGYLEIRQRKEIPQGLDTSVYRASIDFGTSATTLYGSVAGKQTGLISGVNLWSMPLMNTADDTGHNVSRLERFFFPSLPLQDDGSKAGTNKAAPVQMDYEALRENASELANFPACVPLQTILADTKAAQLSRDVFLDSWIYFRSFLQLRDGKHWPEMHTDLKWSHAKANDHNRIQTILTEILLMLALEARSQNCGRISIIASYPLSFDDATRDSYYSALNAMLKKILLQTGLRIHLPEMEGEADEAIAGHTPMVEGITESESVFRFSVRQDALNENYFVVDVGGGSTDIFISLIDGENNRTSSATSLGFGARKVLIEKLLHKDEAILKFMMNAFAADMNEVFASDTNKYIGGFAKRNRTSMVEDMFSIRIPRKSANAAADLIPKTFGDVFLKTCAENTEFKPLQELKKRIAFYMGASIWFSGMMLKGEDTAGTRISLLYTGNGSKMIRWLSPEIDRIRHFLYLLFNAAGDLGMPRENFSIRFTARPKEEVAFGALLDLPEDFFEVGKQAPKQMTFDQIVESTDDFEAYSPVHYEKANIDTSYSDFAGFLRAFKKACATSFDWTFEPDEYDASILNSTGFQSSIKKRIPKMGYFLSALEALSARYMPDEPKNESM